MLRVWYHLFLVLVIIVTKNCLISAQSKDDLDDSMKELMETLHHTCVDETGVSEGEIDRARTGEFPEDQKLKCYMKCILAQVGVIDEDSGDIDGDTLVSLLPPQFHSLANPVIKACGTKYGSDVCDTAFQTNKCWYSQKPNEYKEFLF